MSDIRQEFKIRRQSDGQFSSGGTTPRWSNKGKTWSEQRHVTAHLGLALRNGSETYGGVPLAEVDLVVYEMRPMEAEVAQLADVAADIVGRREQRIRDRERRSQRARLNRLEEEAERIRQRLGEARRAVADSE